jgi:entericidin B
MLKKFVLLALLVALGAPILGCNTTEGVGKDVERGGENLQDAANRNK